MVNITIINQPNIANTTGQSEFPSNCTDWIDLGEDTTSHNYSDAGRVATGAYFCDGNDETIRVGSCSQQGNLSWIMESGTELSFLVAWQSGYTDVYIDDEFLGNISGAGSCETVTFELPDDISSTFKVEIRDPILGCTGDIQLAQACVTGDYQRMFY